jgi:type IV pilus assembly protein PilE
VVVVIAILAAIAYPSYESHVIRTNRSVAQQFLLAVANRQEQYILDANSYTTTLGAGGLALTAPTELAGRYTFAIAVTAGPPPGYTVTATAIGPQSSDGPLTLAADGTKSPAAKWQK